MKWLGKSEVIAIINNIINSNIMFYTHRISVGWTQTDLFGQMAYRCSLSSRELVSKLVCDKRNNIQLSTYVCVWVGACVVLCALEQEVKDFL